MGTATIDASSGFCKSLSVLLEVLRRKFQTSKYMYCNIDQLDSFLAFSILVLFYTEKAFLVLCAAWASTCKEIIHRKCLFVELDKKPIEPQLWTKSFKLPQKYDCSFFQKDALTWSVLRPRLSGTQIEILVLEAFSRRRSIAVLPSRATGLSSWVNMPSI